MTDRTFTMRELEEMLGTALSHVAVDSNSHWPGLGFDFTGFLDENRMHHASFTAEQALQGLVDDMTTQGDVVLEDVGYECEATIEVDNMFSTTAALFGALLHGTTAEELNDPQVMVDILAGNWGLGDGFPAESWIADTLVDEDARAAFLAHVDKDDIWRENPVATSA